MTTRAITYTDERVRLLTDVVIKEFEKYKGKPYPGDIAKAVISALTEMGFHPHTERDRLWCQALIAVLDVDQVSFVLRWFNEHRSDK